MLSGFNTNFRYRGVLFHVQTEDSGRENPHIITHLFYGGNILSSVKSEYADLLEIEPTTVEAAVRKRMESQHKTMLKGLSRGEHDGVIGERMGPDALSSAAGAERGGCLYSVGNRRSPGRHFREDFDSCCGGRALSDALFDAFCSARR